MHLIFEQGPMTRELLSAKAVESFGPAAQFHTCSAQGMDLNSLLDFLVQRGKVNEGAQGLFMGGGEHFCSNE